MVSDVCLKNYVLLLFLGITIVFIWLKQENDSNKFAVDSKITKIENSRKNAIHSPKLLKFKNPNLRNLKNNNLQKICVKYNLTSFLERKHFLYSAENHALYCWIRKIASTSFTKIFSEMEKHHSTDEISNEEEFLSPATTELLKSANLDNSAFKFLIVRHPFERLVSSYRDRIEDNTKFTAQAWIYVSKIFYLTRPKLFRSNTTTGSTLEKIFYIDRRLKLVPTFREFVTYLIQESSDNYDHHWNQYYRHCSLCEINYNFILKLDIHSPKEIEYLVSRLNLRKYEDIINLHATHGGLTDFPRSCKYFHQISCATIWKLYDKYKIDFEMFDYKIDKYLQCCDKRNEQNFVQR